MERSEASRSSSATVPSDVTTRSDFRLWVCRTLGSQLVKTTWERCLFPPGSYAIYYHLKLTFKAHTPSSRCWGDARHETSVPSEVRGPPAGARWRSPSFSGVTGGPRRCLTSGRERATSGQCVWPWSLGAPGWRNGGDLRPGAPSSPVGPLSHVGNRGALGGGVRLLSCPLLSLSLGGNLNSVSL